MRTLDHSTDSLPFFDWKMSEGFLWIPSSLRLRDSVIRCENEENSKKVSKSGERVSAITKCDTWLKGSAHKPDLLLNKMGGVEAMELNHSKVCRTARNRFFRCMTCWARDALKLKLPRAK